MSALEIIGRTSSLFTRVTTIFAHELGVAYTLRPIDALTEIDPAAYADNPALKLPTLRRDGALLFGAENICRALAEVAGGQHRIVWPEQLREDVSRNAQEMVRHAMAAQVQLVFGTIVAKLPADNVYFHKGRLGFAGALRWLEDHLPTALARLPERDVSLFEVMLFCLIEHLSFRGTLAIDPYPTLAAFARAYAERPSSRNTAFRFDAPQPG